MVNVSIRWNMIFSKATFWANVLKITFYAFSRQLKIHLPDVRWIHEDNEGFKRHISMRQNPHNDDKPRQWHEKRKNLCKCKMQCINSNGICCLFSFRYLPLFTCFGLKSLTWGHCQFLCDCTILRDTFDYDNHWSC